MAYPERIKYKEEPNFEHQLKVPEFLTIWRDGENLSGHVLLVPGRSLVGLLRIPRPNAREGGTFVLPTSLEITTANIHQMVVRERRVNAADRLASIHATASSEGVTLSSRLSEDLTIKFEPLRLDGSNVELISTTNEKILLPYKTIQGLHPFYNF